MLTQGNTNKCLRPLLYDRLYSLLVIRPSQLMNRFSLNHFDDFLKIAQQQTEPQRLLLVLAERELPQGHTPEQARQYNAGEGGHLAPLAGVDKLPDDIISFKEFSAESHEVVEKWDVVFVASLPGIDRSLPTPDATDQAIERMLHAIRNGMIGGFLVFDHDGVPINLSIS